MLLDVEPFRIDAISPLVRYNPVTTSSLTGWIPPTRDPNAFYYTDGPHPFVTSSNSSLSLTFFGTGISVHGSIQTSSPSACSYRVDLVPEGLFVQSSTDPGDGILANFANLTAKSRTMTLKTQCNQTTSTRLPANVTFDFADIYPWQNGYTVSNTQIIDDSDPTTLLPYHGDWITAVGTPSGGSYDASRHYTNSNSSFVELTFWGHAIAINGSIDSTQGAYTVSLDSEPPVTYYANSSFPASPVVLYFGAGLDSIVPHVVNISNARAPSYLEIDSFTAYNASAPIDSPDPDDGDDGDNAHDGLITLIPTIIGATLGGIGFCVAMGFTFYAICCMSRIRRRAMKRAVRTPTTPSKRTTFAFQRLLSPFKPKPRQDRSSATRDEDIELANQAGSSRGIDVEGLKADAKKGGDGASKPLMHPEEATSTSSDDPPPAYQPK